MWARSRAEKWDLKKGSELKLRQKNLQAPNLLEEANLLEFTTGTENSILRFALWKPISVSHASDTHHYSL